MELQRRGGLSPNLIDTADWYEVMLFPAAVEGEVALALATIGRTLPSDFLRFWEFSNGANLFVNESGLHGVGIASTGRIGELQRDEEEFYGAAAMAPYAVFARVNGAGDFLVFELETGRVLDGVHAEQPPEWRVIAESFTEWLERFTEASGRYYWIEALYEAQQG
jgi:hypothetical protein